MSLLTFLVSTYVCAHTPHSMPKSVGIPMLTHESRLFVKQCEKSSGTVASTGVPLVAMRF